MGVEFFLERDWLQSGAVFSDGGLLCDGALGPFQNWTKTEHEHWPCWFLPSDFFQISASDFHVAKTQAQFEKSAILERLPEGRMPEGRWEAPSQPLFADQFARSHDRMASGHINKVVPVAFESLGIQLQEEHVAYFLRQGLRYSGQGYFFAHWDLGLQKAVFGFTPELLFEVNVSGTLKSMALAGTAKDSEHDLLNDDKEINEHSIVVNSICDKLKPYGEVEASKTYVWRPSELSHLRTDISAQVGVNSHFNILSDLHPTPALGGDPKFPARDLLKEFAREVPRFQFGAPFGLMNSNRSSRFVVQIRCLIYERGELYLGSGCGLVKESQKEQEWAELKLKRDSVRKIFGL